jgi:hypothetical protein
VNVTIERNVTVGSAESDTLCWDDSESELVPVDACNTSGGDTPLRVGDSPTEGGQTSTITARRVVSLNGEQVTMKVVVW